MPDSSPSIPDADADPAAAARATVDALQPGLALVARDTALAHIDAWHERLSASVHGSLREIAGGLRELKAALKAPDASEIAGVLVQLGEQTTEAAVHADTDDVRHAVERLGHLLLHAGHALRGPLSR